EALKTADVILSLDYVDIGGTLNQLFPPGSTRKAKIINCTMEQQLNNGWLMDYHVLPIADLVIPTTVDAFTNALNARLKPRPDALKGRTSGFSLPEMPKGNGEIGVKDLAATFLNVTNGKDISLVGRPLGWPPNATAISHPHDSLCEQHGGGVGAGPG